MSPDEMDAAMTAILMSTRGYTTEADCAARTIIAGRLGTLRAATAALTAAMSECEAAMVLARLVGTR